MSLAMRTASSSSLTLTTESTGPNTSSWAMRMRLSTSRKMVGLTKYRPPPSSFVAGPPPRTQRAPSALAMSDRIFSYCGGVVTGPTCVSALLGSPSRACRAMATSFSTNTSWIVSCTSSRDPAMQVCPVAAKMPEMAPLTASSMMQSSNTMFGDLPPSSSETFLNDRDASSLTRAPVAVPPVNAILATLGWVTSASPATAPYPVTTLTTPGGISASAITRRMNSSSDAEVYSDGLMTTVQPAASAGASFQPASIRGEFHGVMNAQTPTGSRSV